MSKESLFLLLAAVGLTPIALSYGFMPQASMGYLFNIDASDVNSTHVFRSIMGLYLALAIFWLIGARNKSLTRPALWSLTIFMLGLGAGRVLSIVIDGIPHPLLVTYLVLEVGFGSTGYILARRFQAQ